MHWHWPAVELKALLAWQQPVTTPFASATEVVKGV
jgi:hypothetical protein